MTPISREGREGPKKKNYRFHHEKKQLLLRFEELVGRKGPQKEAEGRT